MVDPQSGGANTGFRCASGEFLNSDKSELAIEGLDTSQDGMSQEKLQQVTREACTYPQLTSLFQGRR